MFVVWMCSCVLIDCFILKERLLNVALVIQGFYLEKLLMAINVLIKLKFV